MNPSHDFRLPRGSEGYLALQRTAYQHPANRLFRRLRMGPLYDRYLLPRIEMRRSKALSRCYADDLEMEFDSLLPGMPARAARLLDIGCGLAGIDLWLYRHFGPETDLHLLDRDGVSKVFYGFEAEGAFYNSLKLARELLEMNGVPGQRVHTSEIRRDGFPGAKPFDLVVSLISWGFHYPVSTYAQQVHDALAPGGHLILDLRRDTNGKGELAELFKQAPSVLKGTPKYERVRFVKRQG